MRLIEGFFQLLQLVGGEDRPRNKQQVNVLYAIVTSNIIGFPRIVFSGVWMFIINAKD